MSDHPLQKYLPSKRFAAVLGICAGGLLFVLIISSLFGSHTFFNPKVAHYPLVQADGTISTLVEQDSNNNGIPDWEESLWGLDPKGDGDANKKIIEQKEVENGVIPGSAGMTPDGAALTQNDQFVRSLLSTILALNQSGSLTPDALTKLSDSIGQNLRAKRDPVVPTYSLKDISVPRGSAAVSDKKYIALFRPILDKATAAGIGTEWDVMSQGLDENGTPGSLKGLIPIANAYTQFGKDLVSLNTPSDVVFYSLTLANASTAVGTALTKTSNIYTDSISGMIGLDDYLTAFDTFDKTSGNLAKHLAAAK